MDKAWDLQLRQADRSYQFRITINGQMDFVKWRMINQRCSKMLLWFFTHLLGLFQQWKGEIGGCKKDASDRDEHATMQCKTDQRYVSVIIYHLDDVKWLFLMHIYFIYKTGLNTIKNSLIGSWDLVLSRYKLIYRTTLPISL